MWSENYGVFNPCNSFRAGIYRCACSGTTTAFSAFPLLTDHRPKGEISEGKKNVDLNFKRWSIAVVMEVGAVGNPPEKPFSAAGRLKFTWQLSRVRRAHLNTKSRSCRPMCTLCRYGFRCIQSDRFAVGGQCVQNKEKSHNRDLQHWKSSS